MSQGRTIVFDEDHPKESNRKPLKLILVGDSAVGKSKLIERYLMDKYCPIHMSTFALMRFEHETRTRRGAAVSVDIWDTGGAERFTTLHPAYMQGAHCCILVFECTRKSTYKNLDRWLKEVREVTGDIPILVVCNKIDCDPAVTWKTFQFPARNFLPCYFTSAAEGTNVATLFEAAIEAAATYRAGDDSFLPASDYAPLLVECVPQPLIPGDLTEHCCSFLSRLEAGQMFQLRHPSEGLVTMKTTTEERPAISVEKRKS